MNYSVPDPNWKVCPDIVAEESFEALYGGEEADEEEDP